MKDATYKKCWEEGRKAADDGKDYYNDNPYNSGTSMYGAWKQGFENIMSKPVPNLKRRR